MEISKSEFIDWKSNIVTRAFFDAINERIEDAKEILGHSAGLDSISDNFYRGFIHAYKEALDFKIEDDSEEG